LEGDDPSLGGDNSFMSTEKSAQVHSIQAKINRVAKERGATAPQMLTMFLLERAAVRLMVDDKLRSSLVFKGGYVGVRVYNSPRYTTDAFEVTITPEGSSQTKSPWCSMSARGV